MEMKKKVTLRLIGERADTGAEVVVASRQFDRYVTDEIDGAILA